MWTVWVLAKEIVTIQFSVWKYYIVGFYLLLYVKGFVGFDSERLPPTHTCRILSGGPVYVGSLPQIVPFPYLQASLGQGIRFQQMHLKSIDTWTLGIGYNYWRTLWQVISK